PLARTHPGQVAVPDEPVHLGQLLPRLPPRLVEQAQLDPPRHLREQREVRARAVPGGAQRIGVTGPNLPHVATPPPVRPGPSIVTYPPSSSPHPPPFNGRASLDAFPTTPTPGARRPPRRRWSRRCGAGRVWRRRPRRGGCP